MTDTENTTNNTSNILDLIADELDTTEEDKISAAQKVELEVLKKEQEMFFDQIKSQGPYSNIICIATGVDEGLEFYQLHPDMHEAIFYFEFLKNRILTQGN